MKSSKIVVVDDEDDILELIRYNLEKEKASVQTFTSGIKALQAIREQAPDLVICDWMLEDIDGLDICRLLKRDPALSHIPFVMLTARSDEIDAVTALELGADEYLTKPIRMRELVTRVKKIIARTNPQSLLPDQADTTEPPPNDKILVFGKLTMNIDNYTATIDAQLIDLTYTEFKLLQLLISKPGRVYTRNQIMEKINGMDYFATERSIDVQVAGLRKKLGRYKEYVETVRGVGYRAIE